MALPLITFGARALLSKLAKRYAGKSLSNKEARDLRAATIKKLRKKDKPVTEEAVLKGTRNRARLKGAGKLAGDVSGVALVTENISDSLKLDDVEKKRKLLKAVKEKAPKLYKQFRDSEFTDIEEFLKSKGLKLKKLSQSF